MNKEYKTNFTNFRVGNFKSFSNPVDFPIRPITLLFGPNSSGKSSFLKALLLLKQTINSYYARNLRPNGDLINLGSYEEFVYNHDKEKKISFDLSINIKDIQQQLILDPSYIWKTIGERENLKMLSLDNPIDDDRDLNSSELLINKISSICNRYKTAHMSFQFLHADGDIAAKGIGYWECDSIKIYLGDEKEWCFDFYFDIDGEQESIHFNFKHSFWKLYWDTFDKQDNNRSLIENLKDLPYYSSEYKDSFTIINEEHQCYKQALKLYELIFTSYTEIIYNLEGDTDGEQICLKMIKEGHLEYGPTIIFSLINYALKKSLKNIHYIEALRASPARHYVFNKNLSSSTYDGAAIPHQLFKDHTLLNSVNKQLKKINIPYKIRISKFINKETSVESNTVYSLDLLSVNNGCYNNFTDVGFGISQILPIIVQCCLAPAKYGYPDTIVIEQPELHLHPSMQAEIGDLFINTALKNKKGESQEILDRSTNHKESATPTRHNSLIIETHSEHLILRILRRIRETAEGRNDSTRPIYPEDVSVLYVQPGKEGAEVIHIPVNKEGEFERPWPQGFFAERARELF